jgi:hypothetical protein
MKMTGSRQIQASQSEVWAKLNDVEVLKRCIPGCQSLEQTGENQLKATVGLKIGPMNAKFGGDVTLSDLDPPRSYRISGKGQGGAAGFASGGADVKLEAKDGGTLLSYDVDATVGGKLAQLGARLIDATAAQLANQFFDRFSAEFAPAAADSSVVPTTEPTGSGTPTSVGPSQQGLPTWLWWSVGALFVIVVFYYFR